MCFSTEQMPVVFRTQTDMPIDGLPKNKKNASLRDTNIASIYETQKSWGALLSNVSLSLCALV